MREKQCNGIYEKQCNGMYLEKYSKNGNLLRTAEQFNSSCWVIWEYPSSRTNMQGEYTNKEFEKIRRRLF